LRALFESSLTLGIAGAREGGIASIQTLGTLAAKTLFLLSALALVPTLVVGVLVEFLQVGPVFSTEKLTPKAEKLNPVDGIQRMFSIDNLVELFKNVCKLALVVTLVWLAVRGALPSLPSLLQGSTAQLGGLMWAVFWRALVGVAFAFALVAAMDLAWQHHAYTKKMRMSIRDIRQEMKDAEGDPVLKGQRRQLQNEWAQQGASQAARDASALVVNPSHVAIAIHYDRVQCPVPIVTAKGEEETALGMRMAAGESGVPVVRNKALARTLLARAEVGDVVPAELFEVVAEVILWARECRHEVQRCRADPWTERRPTRIPVPGQDLTRCRANDPLAEDEDDESAGDARTASSGSAPT
jgi:type III secretion protein U